ncbi:transporter substrate-binding domain-containing protein [Simiduia litorea]|uniref:substrate-binding periplasmic protein n=1 Tax=Simiduia litorea TaxID=1435348 RepID=UPI0036F44866
MGPHLTAILLGLLLTIAGDANATDATVTAKIVVPTRDVATTADTDFFFPLLNLALSKTIASDGPFETSYHPLVLSSARILSKLDKGDGIDVVWTSTSTSREQNFRPVPISLLRELADYKVLLINADEQPRFNRIATLEDLKTLRAGVGGHWPDAKLLSNNGFNIATSIYYESLFKMLAAKRFDFFSRGLFEAWYDLEQHPDMGLTIEKTLMLYYPAPFYFFVRKDNKALADRLERGLKIAQADGSFDALLNSIPAFRRGNEEFNQHKRKVFTLESKY